jgi:hypothetical protein
LPGRADPLLDQPAAEIGVDQIPLGSGNGVGQPVVGNFLRLGEAREPSRPEHSHAAPCNEL